MVSAWASANNLVLAQRKVDDKSNEITAIPKLLDALELSGTVVTIDAMGCQRSIAEKIVAKKADYILAVKENQGHLLAEIKDSFQMLAADGVSEEIDCGHGRVEQRRCSVIADLSLLEKASEWASLQGLVRIESERYHKATGKTETEIRYYITSLKSRRGAAESGHSPATGASKTSYTGHSMSASEKTWTANAPAMPRRTSPCSTASPSTCSDRTKPASSASKENDSKAGWDNDYLLQLLGN